MILPRYLYRQASGMAALTLLVLLGVVSALFLAELLSQAASGQVPGASLLVLLILRLPEAVLMVAPLALLVGVLLALGQASETSEVTIARASGVSYVQCFRPLMGLAVAWALAVLLIAGWVSPWALKMSDEWMAKGAEQAMMASVQPGQFDRFDGGRLTMYTASVDPGTGTLVDVFVQHSASESEEVISAPAGRLWHDATDQSRYLSLHQGHQVRRSHAGELMRLSFDENNIRLPDPDDRGLDQTEMTLSLDALVHSQTPEQRREWHWRLASPVGTLLLGLLAIPLAWRAPRAGRFGSVVVAMLVYLVYSNGVHFGLVGMEKANAMSGFGLWPVHGALAVCVACLCGWRWRAW